MVDVQGAVEPQQIHNCADHRLTFDDGKNALVLDSRFKIEGLDGEDHPFESWFLALLEHDPHTLDDVVAREPEVRHGISQLSYDLTAQENILLWSLVEAVKQVAHNPRALTYGDLKAHYLAVARSYPEMFLLCLSTTLTLSMTLLQESLKCDMVFLNFRMILLPKKIFSFGVW